MDLLCLLDFLVIIIKFYTFLTGQYKVTWSWTYTTAELNLENETTKIRRGVLDISIILIFIIRHSWKMYFEAKFGMSIYCPVQHVFSWSSKCGINIILRGGTRYKSTDWRNVFIDFPECWETLMSFKRKSCFNSLPIVSRSTNVATCNWLGLPFKYMKSDLLASTLRSQSLSKFKRKWILSSLNHYNRML